jgi:serine/threonine protein kinase
MSTSPRRLGKYELHERLGQSEIGEVWKAFDPQLQRYFAIKILQVDTREDPEFTVRFNHVARALTSLQHRNIVPVHNFHISQASESNSITAHIVMDYVEGLTLGEYIQTTSSMGNIPSPATIVQLFASISAAIDYAHQHNMSHRDIKPTNILLDKRNTARNAIGEPMLTDLGLIDMLMTFGTSKLNSKILNPLYISPEQAQGLAGTAQSDIYSLGVILYEVCTGMHPYKGGTPPAILMQHVSATPTPPALYHPNIPPAVTMVILRSLAKDPMARFPSASSMTEALAEALSLPVPEISTISEYTIDPRNSPTYIAGMPIEGVRFEARRQQGDAVSPGTLASGERVALSQSNLPPFATPISQATPSTPQFASTTNAGASTPMTGRVNAWGTLQASPPPGLPVIPSTPTTQVKARSLPTTPAPVTSPPTPKRGRKTLLTALIVTLLIVLVGAGLGTFYALNQNKGPVAIVNPIAGHSYFLSSGLSNEISSQGINDELQIDLQNVPAPAAGTSYYAWLLGDENKSEAGSLLLGSLSVNQGKVHFIYTGDRQHDNLLANYSRFLVTEEDANITPVAPSVVTSSWRYIAELPQKPDPKDTVHHFSVLAHLRHLLSADPTLDGLKLHGGLGIWLVRNVEKVQEWAGSARDYWTSKDTNLMRDQLKRILDYLDSTTYVGQDVLSANPVIVDQRIAKVALLEFSPDQQPPGYLTHISHHVQGVIGAPGATTDQRNLASQIYTDLNNATKWLTQVRKDAKQLVNLPDEQLLSQNSLSLLNDMAAQALYAYVGQLNLSTNNVREGVIQIYYHLAAMASLEITQYKM